MRAPVTVVVVVTALALGGCRKKSAHEFYELESRATILIARDGDEGLMSDEMTSVLAALKVIPTDTVEGPKARALLEKIEADRHEFFQKRLEAERAQAATQAPRPSRDDLAPSPAPAPRVEAPEVPDAGPSMPWGNMTLAEFQQRFGVCMEGAGEKEVPGQGRMTAFEVIKTPTCIVKYGIPDEETRHFYLFREGRLAAERTEQRVVTFVDAGRAAAPPRIEPPPSPYVMGMPTGGGADAQ